MRISATPASSVISDTVEGDTIVVDVNTGAYYTLTASASILWGQAQVDGECEVDDVAVPVLRAMLAEGLLVGALDGAEVFDSAIAFTRYTDMEQLLLADPIHEVDAEGWPVLKPPAAEA